MDANRARFHALWGHAGDWEGVVAAPGADPNVKAADGLLRLKDLPPAFGDLGDSRLKPEARRGAARDRFGNWYWIDPTGRQVLVQSSGTGAIGVFWPVPAAPRDGPFAPAGAPGGPGPLAGLTVTRRHALVVGTLQPAGLLAFNLISGGAPRRVAPPAGTAFAPFDLAPLGDGFVALDRDNRAVWAFDRDLVPRAVTTATANDLFQPANAARPPRVRESAGAAAPLPAGWPAPVAVATVSPELIQHERPAPSATGTAEPVSCDEAWVLHEPGLDPPAAPNNPPRVKTGSPLSRVNWSGPLPVTARPVRTTQADSSLTVQTQAPDGTLRTQPVGGHDFTFVTPNRLEVALTTGTQAVAFDRGLAPGSDFIPLRRFEGRAYTMSAGGAGDRPGYDTGGTWADAAVMPRPRFAPAASLTVPGPNGWDGQRTACVWHRVALDANIPPGCSVRIAAEVSDDLTRPWVPVRVAYLPAASPPAPTGASWQPNPRPRAEGCELPFAPALPTGFRTWETFLHGARGRHLRLTLELTGDGTRTPRVRALRAWYPRFSYLEHYLPAIYRDDPDSADFLERFLANAEGTLTGLEDKIAAARSLVDPRTAPAEALDWLSGWLGAAASPGWSERKKRLFLRHAPEILRRRGTVRGLQWALHLELDDCIAEGIFDTLRTDTSPYRIIETFRRRRTAPVPLGDPTGLDLPRIAAPAEGGKWTPRDGPAKLNDGYGAALEKIGRPRAPFPLCRPTDPTVRGVWDAFARDALGFVPRAQPGDPDDERWAAFLYRRYRRPELLAEKLPLTLGVRPSVASDWYLFETVVVAAGASAHRFEVLIPSPASPAPADLARAFANRERARAVVRREAPAHCRFEVRLYASAFRVGGSRVGADTLLGPGAHAPAFYDAAVLDDAFVGEAFLRPRPPRDEPDLTVVGQTPMFRARSAPGASPR